MEAKVRISFSGLFFRKIKIYASGIEKLFSQALWIRKLTVATAYAPDRRCVRTHQVAALLREMASWPPS